MTTAVTNVRLTLGTEEAAYQPGELLSGQYFVEGAHAISVRSSELSVLWYTMGKGDEDMAVHHFERLVDDPSQPLDLSVPRQFSTILPVSPLSYGGDILKICWSVRLRLFLAQGQESLAEVPFRLGSIPSRLQGLDEDR
jgi:hypothetical protein